MQGQDHCREGSASSVPRPKPEMVPTGPAPASPALLSASDSPNLEKLRPPATTPASDPGSSLGLSSGADQSRADSAGTVADDVFSAPDSPHKEFHCAVLRALNQDPTVVEAAKADQAPGTLDEAESCLSSGLPLPSPCSSLARLTTPLPLHWWESGIPPSAVSSPLF